MLGLSLTIIAILLFSGCFVDRFFPGSGCIKKKYAGLYTLFYLHLGAGSPRLQAQQLHLSEAPLQTQPWAHLAQPTGQQEQQLFLQEAHLQSLHLQEPAHVQDSPAVQEQLGSMAS